MKKKAVFFGNCHNQAIINFLQKNKEFDSEYEVHAYANWMVLNGEHTINHDHIKSADLFVYQPLPASHGEYSTDSSVKNSIGNLLKKDCKKISFPYTYYSALWPISQAGIGESQKFRWFGSEVIDKLRVNHSDEEILWMYCHSKIDWEYERRHIETLNILRSKEANTDVKISSFIESNFTSKNLFLIPQHPTSIVFLEKANQVLDILGMCKLSENVIASDNEGQLEDSTYQLSSCRWPLHSSAIEHFKISWDYIKRHNCTHNGEVIDPHNFYKFLIVKYMKMFPRGQKSSDWKMFEENSVNGVLKS